MDIGKQTASVVSTPIKKIDILKEDKEIGILGCINPASYNQRELFYFSQTTFKIRLVDDDLNVLPTALSNPLYPQSYEMIFFDRGSDNDNPDGWVNLFNINARTLLNIEKGTPWSVSWEFDGSCGVQTATIKGVAFSRVTTKDTSGKINGFDKWIMHSPIPYGSTRITFQKENDDHLNNLGWVSSSFMIGQGIDIIDYPDAFKAIQTLIQVDNVANKIFEINTTSDRESIRLKQTWRGNHLRFIGNQGNSNPDAPSASPGDSISYAHKGFEGNVCYIVATSATNYSGLLSVAYNAPFLYAGGGLHDGKDWVTLRTHTPNPGKETRPNSIYLDLEVFIGI